jgi:hypothetical protein
MNEFQRSQMTRYLIDESALSFEASRELGVALLGWAADGADRFELILDEGVYADPRAVIQLFDPISVKVTRRGVETTVITGGTPPAGFADLVTNPSFLVRSVSGDLTNVEVVALYVSQRRRYLAADYGRTQILLLDQMENSQLRSRLRDAGQDETVLTQIPLDEQKNSLGG